MFWKRGCGREGGWSAGVMGGLGRESESCEGVEMVV